MLPTRPRALDRSTWSSCTTACSSTATRVSCGVTLIRISLARSSRASAANSGAGRPFTVASSEYATPGARQQRRGLRERQAYDARVAAVDALDERGGETLHRVRAGLVERLAGADVARDLVAGERRELDARHRHRERDVVAVAQRDAGHDLVRAAREARQHLGRVRGVARLAEHDAVDHHLGVGAKHRIRRELAAADGFPARARLGARDALDVMARRLAVARLLEDVG